MGFEAAATALRLVGAGRALPRVASPARQPWAMAGIPLGFSGANRWFPASIPVARGSARLTRARLSPT
jgi:hypothetical protein